jgi:hypothetical protein
MDDGVCRENAIEKEEITFILNISKDIDTTNLSDTSVAQVSE